MAIMEAQMQLLKRHGLNSSVLMLGGYTLSVLRKGNAPAAELSEATLTYAKALFEDGQLRRAKQHFEQAKQTMASAGLLSKPTKWSAEVVFWIGRCHMELGEVKTAIALLSSIPTKQRSPLASMTLAQLLEKRGDFRLAMASYRDVLRNCPLSLEAMQGLLELGVASTDLKNELERALGNADSTIEWVYDWIDGHAQARKKQFARAAQTFHQLEQKRLPNNPDVLMKIAAWTWKQGVLPVASAAFERARQVDPLNLDHTDAYAHVLVSKSVESDLNRLATELLAVDKSRIEPWLAVARYCQLCCENGITSMDQYGHASQGIYFADKAAQIDPCNNEMLVIKGSFLLALEKPEQARRCFRQAYEQSGEFAAYQGLVGCFLSIDRVRDALLIAKEAQQAMPQNPRAITLLGVVCARCADGGSKARRAFENALSLEPGCMDAVYALVDLEIEEHNFDAAISLLAKNAQHSRLDYIHHKLGEVHLAAGNATEAFKEYSLALAANPKSVVAKEGLARAKDLLDGTGAGEAEEPMAEGNDEGSDGDNDLDMSHEYSYMS